jgi:hypothetical protein
MAYVNMVTHCGTRTDLLPQTAATAAKRAGLRHLRHSSPCKGECRALPHCRKPIDDTSSDPRGRGASA